DAVELARGWMAQAVVARVRAPAAAARVADRLAVDQMLLGAAVRRARVALDDHSRSRWRRLAGLDGVAGRRRGRRRRARSASRERQPRRQVTACGDTGNGDEQGFHACLTPSRAAFCSRYSAVRSGDCTMQERLNASSALWIDSVPIPDLSAAVNPNVSGPR